MANSVITRPVTDPASTPLGYVDDIEGQVVALPTERTFNEARHELQKIAAERRDLAARERAIRKVFQKEGGSSRALKFVRSCDAMDPDERRAYVEEVQAYLTYLEYM